MKKEKFKKGNEIVKEGTYENTFYLNSKCKVIISKVSKALRILQQGEYLDEKSLLSDNSLRTANVIWKEKVIYYAIYIKEFDMVLSDSNIRDSNTK